MDDPLAALLRGYQPQGVEETSDLARVTELVRTAADPWSRDTPLHVTASALIVHPDSGQILLRWHPRQQAWLQVGGHADPGERDPLAIALREAAEETGLPDLTPWPVPELTHLVVVPVTAGRASPSMSTRICGSCSPPGARGRSRQSDPMRRSAGFRRRMRPTRRASPTCERP